MRIGIIGGGNMGEALLSGILKKRLLPKNSVRVSEKDSSKRNFLRRRYGVSVTNNNRELASYSHVVILAVKPQKVEEVLREIAPLPKGSLVISIAAGVRLSLIERHLGRVPIVRVMPNLAAAVGEAISVMVKGRYAASRHGALAEKLFQSVGETVWMEESKLDAVTAVSGSGPAYVALFLKALQEGAETLGLPKKAAERLVQKTFQGSVAYLGGRKVDPALFIQKVASKGGTTEAALRVFKRRRFSQTIALALRAAARRSQQLSRG